MIYCCFPDLCLTDIMIGLHFKCITEIHGFWATSLQLPQDRVLNAHLVTDPQIQRAGQTTSKQVQLQ